MIHKTSWEYTKLLTSETGKLLETRKNCMLCVLFIIGNKHTSQRNFLLDGSLKNQNIQWGARDLEKVSKESSRN